MQHKISCLNLVFVSLSHSPHPLFPFLSLITKVNISLYHKINQSVNPILLPSLLPVSQRTLPGALSVSHSFCYLPSGTTLLKYRATDSQQGPQGRTSLQAPCQNTVNSGYSHVGYSQALAVIPLPPPPSPRSGHAC